MKAATRVRSLASVLVLLAIIAAAALTEKEEEIRSKQRQRLSGIIIPGFASTQLRAWSILDCPYSPLDFNPLDLVWLDTTKLLSAVNCWLKCMLLDPYNQADHPECKSRPDSGLSAITELDPGYITGPLSSVWKDWVKWCIEFGIEPNAIIAVPYDWRLSPSMLEQRDLYFHKLKLTFETALKLRGVPSLVFAHSLGNNVFRYFLEWLKLEIAPKQYLQWLDEHIHAYFAVAAPLLGSTQTIEASLSGFTYGLPISEGTARLLFNSFASSLWMMPFSKYCQTDKAYWKHFSLGSSRGHHLYQCDEQEYQSNYSGWPTNIINIEIPSTRGVDAYPSVSDIADDNLSNMECGLPTQLSFSAPAEIDFVKRLQPKLSEFRRNYSAPDFSKRVLEKWGPRGSIRIDLSAIRNAIVSEADDVDGVVDFDTARRRRRRRRLRFMEETKVEKDYWEPIRALKARLGEFERRRSPSTVDIFERWKSGELVEKVKSSLKSICKEPEESKEVPPLDVPELLACLIRQSEPFLDQLGVRKDVCDKIVESLCCKRKNQLLTRSLSGEESSIIGNDNINDELDLRLASVLQSTGHSYEGSFWTDTAKHDMTDQKRHVAIVTTASLPWMTGTAVNPLFRAAYLAKSAQQNVTLLVPWLCKSDQELVYPNNITFGSPEEQETYIRNWLEERIGFKADFKISFYPGKFQKERRSIIPAGDTSQFIPSKDADIAVLEEPEHLNWYHHGRRWTDKFNHVVGVVHTNYLEYIKREKNGALQAFLVKHSNGRDGAKARESCLAASSLSLSLRDSSSSNHWFQLLEAPKMEALQSHRVEMLSIAVAVVAVAAGTAYYFYLQKKPKGCLDPENFKEFQLVKRTQLSHNVAKFRFALPTPSSVLGLPIGQHMSCRGKDSVGEEVIKPYTPTTLDSDVGYFELVIKMYPQGRMSHHFREMREGDYLAVKGPKGRFKYQPGQVRAFGMLAGGTGITPMFQVARAILENPCDKTKIYLIYANVTYEDILLKEELDNFAQSFPDQFHVYYVLNQPPEIWDGGVGFVSKEMIQTHCPAPASDIQVLRCGPPPMNKAMAAHLDELGYTSQMQFKF